MYFASSMVSYFYCLGCCIIFLLCKLFLLGKKAKQNQETLEQLDLSKFVTWRDSYQMDWVKKRGQVETLNFHRFTPTRSVTISIALVQFFRMQLIMSTQCSITQLLAPLIMRQGVPMSRASLSIHLDDHNYALQLAKDLLYYAQARKQIHLFNWFDRLTINPHCLLTVSHTHTHICIY